MVGLLLLLAAVPAAFAQQAPSREQELIRRLRQQVQQLQQAQAEQQQAAIRAGAELATLQKRFDALQADAGRLRGAAASQTRSAAELTSERDALTAANGALQARLDEAKTELEQRAKAQEQLRAELAQGRALLDTRAATFGDLQARHQRQAQGLQACIDNNARLHALGLELLDRYERKGVGELLHTQEPLLQFGRVRLENLLQGYREQLDQSALKPAPSRGS